jgi:hypothetical protein
VDATRTAALLGRLHRAAERQTQLGDLGESAATRPETRVYGAELKSQFGALDDRVRAFAAANGITQGELDRVAPGENVVAMRRHVDDLAQLANAHGETFDRDFWVAVATEQAATSDLLAATLEQEPALAGVVSDFSALLDKTSRRASVAAEASVPTTTPPPAAPESQPPSSGDAD